MDRETWQRLEPLFEEALERRPEDRPPFLERVRAEDAELGGLLAALLEADRAATGFLAEPAGALGVLSGRDRPTAAGPLAVAPALERIGPYRVLGLLGQGGMGAVYLAERDDGQYRQQVAIKVASSLPGRDDLQHRLRRERQIQARLVHRNIARLLDGGVIEGGLPYLVMEHVDGRPITEHCRDAAVTVEGRIRLFLEACAAVAYAHRHLVVHRDLKPSNILVTREGEVKLVDFGIAALLEPDGASGERTWAPFFTPDYAAPEQRAGRAVTTATDVFALGLVLDELLTGRRLLAGGGASTQEVRTRLETAGPAPSRVRDRPGEGPISPDLDAICLMALRPEPDLRYPHAEALREDLLRYLSHRPVEARQGNRAYRARKFVERNRGLAASLLVVLLTVVAAALASFRQARITAAERDRAVKAEARVRSLNEFLVHDMLKAATPEGAQGRPPTVADVLAAAARRVGASFAGDPEQEADVRLALGRSYLSLGNRESAFTHVKEAAALRSRALGERHPETLEAVSELGAAHLALGRYTEARGLLEPALSAQRALAGPDDLGALLTEGRLAEVLLSEGQFLQAEERLVDVLRRIEVGHPLAWREALLLRTALGRALNPQRKDGESEALLRATLVLQRDRLGEDHPDTLATQGLLLDSLRRLLRYDEARPLALEHLARHERVYGRDHPQTINALEILGRIYWYSEPSRAEALFLDALERARARLGPEHPTVVSTLLNLAQNAKMLKKWDTAEARYREALALSRRVHGDEHATTLRGLRFLAQFLSERGRAPEARRVFAEIVSVSERMAAKPDADATFLNDYAWLLMSYVPADMRDPVRATPLAERAVALTARRQVEFLHSLARAHRQTGRLPEAIAVMREIYTLPDAVHRYDVERDLIEYLEASGEPGAVEAFLRENLARRRAARQRGDPLIGQTLRLVGLEHAKRGRLAEAEKELRAARTELGVRLPESSREVARVESELGEVVLDQGRVEEARVLLERAHRHLADHDDILPASQARLQKLARHAGRSPEPLSSPEPARD